MNPADYKPRVGLWSQRDWRWANKQLGTSGAKMGPKGCAVTCLAIIILRDYWDRYQKNPPKIWRPGDVCDWMSKNGKFTPQGDAYLNTVDVLTNGHCINVYDKSEARYTMIQVIWGGQTHWVVKLDGDLCLDPWDGVIKKLEQTKWRVNGIQRWFKI